MARLGADLCGFVGWLAGQEIDFYQRSSLSLEKDESKLEELYELALQREEESPMIGQLAILGQASASRIIPGLQGLTACSMFLVEQSRWSTLSESFARS